MIDEFLVSFLMQDSAIAELADEIAVGEVPVDADTDELLVETYIWLSTYDEEDHLDLDGEAGITDYRFDCEVCSTDDRTAKKLGRLVKKRLQGYGPGPFGEIELENGTIVPGTVEATFVESKDDDYIPVNRFEISAVSVVAFDLLVIADDAQDDQQAGD